MCLKSFKRKVILWYARRHPVWFIERYVKVDTGHGHQTQKVKLSKSQKRYIKKLHKIRKKNGKGQSVILQSRG